MEEIEEWLRNLGMKIEEDPKKGDWYWISIEGGNEVGSITNGRFWHMKYFCGEGYRYDAGDILDEEGLRRFKRRCVDSIEGEKNYRKMLRKLAIDELTDG